MIALKCDGRVYISVSRKLQNDPSLIKTGVPNKENLRVWRGNRKNRLMAAPADNVYTQAIRHSNVFPKELNVKSILLEVYPKCKTVAEFFGYLVDEKGLPNEILFAEGEKAFVLYNDSTVMEVEDIFSCMSYEELVIGAYDKLGASDPYEFFKTVYKMLEEISGDKLFPVTVMNTKDNKIKVIKGE